MVLSYEAIILLLLLLFFCIVCYETVAIFGRIL